MCLRGSALQVVAVEVLPEACHKRVGAFLKPAGLATQVVQGIAFANPHRGILAHLLREIECTFLQVTNNNIHTHIRICVRARA